MAEKYYQLGTHTAEQWHEIHNELCDTTTGLDNIPDRACTCHDEKTHSPTRGIFLLTDEEAETLKADSRIKFVNIDYTSYPETFRPPPEELQSTSAELLTRWQGNVKVYREFETSNTLPGTPDGTDVNRTGYQLLRPMQKLDPWVDGSLADNAVVNSNIQQYGDGRDVDVIVADDGAGWIGHPEFQNNTTGAKPTDYTGGNVLPGNGTCDVLDLVLDAPYYLDPDYFDANPGARLTTRWDGTVVPVESIARLWWTSLSYRSAAFNTANPNVGVIPFITSSYTRNNCNGSNTAQSAVGTHCTPCMALTYGRTQGWAYNANKWALNLYGTYGADIEPGFDIQKIFHMTKPINPKYGTKNPTVSSNSWGYRASKGDNPGWYHFREDAPVTYNGTGDEPTFISHMGLTGDGGRWKSEMKTNSLTTALDELIDSGVIFVCAAGNSNQKQTNWGQQDFNNYISANSDDTLEESSYLEFGVETTGTTNRRGFPQQGGKYFTDTTVSYSVDALANSSIAYTLSNGTDRNGAVSGDNAGITIRQGDTISITNNATIAHPMFIKTAATTGTGDQVTGATGQGAYDGSVVSWTPVSTGTYYYQCSVHSSMNGIITVIPRETLYKTINIGALDDDYATGNLERKVNYSDRGNGIDFYMPADGTLAANRAYTSEGVYPDTYPGFTANSGSGAGVPEDCAFGGTSAACPVAAGFVATLVGLNRDWTYQDVLDYIAGLDTQDAGNFYYGTESTSANDTNWTDYNSLEGGTAKVGYQDPSAIQQTTFPKRAATFSSGLNLNNIKINYAPRFDRG